MKSFLLITFVALSLLGCEPQSTTSAPTPAAEKTSVAFRHDGELDLLRGGENYLTLDIEIADNDSSITRGLMQRDGMPDLSGMLFLMPTEDIQSFWMSNTTISLDIIFINGQMEIVHIAKYTTPLSPNSVPSEYPAAYVLEVIAGFADTHGILEGDQINWRRNGE
ncbi:MAG: DUF192 domain-containing protein [Rhodothermales bacterium]